MPPLYLWTICLGEAATGYGSTDSSTGVSTGASIATYAAAEETPT